MVIAVMMPSATETFGVDNTSMSAVPNFGVAVTFAAGFGGTVGVDVVGGATGIDDDVGRTDVSAGGDAVSDAEDWPDGALTPPDEGASVTDAVDATVPPVVGCEVAEPAFSD
jgi:hypothetical protein